ncbi:MAG: preprotein translocase subunit YajC [Clostridia bacterium]|nr:preprotein translocase subunit YajC [Clostridia bacterium]
MNPDVINTLYIVGIFVILYFFMIRPQMQHAKKKKQLLESLQVNDKVVTAGGIYGTILKIKDNAVTLRIADKVEIEVLKSAIMMQADEVK